MRTSETIDAIATAMSKAQGEMGSAVKGSNNPFFKSKYADLSSIIKVIKKPFSDNGLSFVQFPISQEGSCGVITRVMHSSGQWLEAEYYLPLSKKDAHAIGSAITYARRYALQSIGGIPSEDDDGVKFTSASEPLITKEHEAMLNELISKTKTEVSGFLSYFKINALSELPEKKLAQAKYALENKLEKKV